MSQQGIDRRISRCKKKLRAAEKESAYYGYVKDTHVDLASCLAETQKSFEKAFELLNEPKNKSFPEMVFIPLENMMPWKDCYRLYDEGMNRFLAWSLQHHFVAEKCIEFYVLKINLLKAKIEMLELQKGYEQQPAA